MKKLLSAILAFALLLGCLAGCGEKKEKKDLFPVYEGLEFTELKNGNYKCSVTKDAPADLTIPSEYGGKKVTVLGSEDDGCPNLEKLTVSSSLENINYGAFKNSPMLQSVVFEGEIDEIHEGAFNSCPKLQTVTFNGAVRSIESAFDGCPKLEPIILPDDSQAENCISESVTIGKKDSVDWHTTMNTQKYFTHARKHLGENYDDKAKITIEDALKFRTQLNGLVIYTDMCADCIPENFSSEKISDKMNLMAADCRNAQKALSSDERTQAEANEASDIYALVEAIGNRDVIYGGNYGQILNRISYRISVWNEKTDELLGWFYLIDIGYAPKEIVAGDGSKTFSLSARDNNNHLRDENGNALTPLFIVEKYVYGAEKSVI